MKAMNWKYTQIITNEELPKDNWLRGYFHSSHYNWDGKHWVRNLVELRDRDLALFALGDVQNKRILDVGCGSGIYMDIIANMGGQVSGQDISPSAVDEIFKNLKEKGFNAYIKVGNATELLFDDNYFDGVIAADFFEHINREDKIQVMSQIYRVLKPGGILVIKTPNLDFMKIWLFLNRILAILKLKSPFNVYIPHTHDNPDNQHCGLTTYNELEKILFDSMFHCPKITFVPLIRGRIPLFITKLLYGKKRFTQPIIISARKPLFYGFYP